VRIGDAVHRTASRNAPFVAALLQYLESIGFPGVPRYRGRNGGGYEVFSFLPGQVPKELGFFSDAQLKTAAAFIRSFHDATAEFRGKGPAETVCHGDLSPCNFVFRSECPYGLIDFDAAAPGKRAEDLGYATWLWLDLGNDEISPEEQRRRLALFITAYGSDVCDPVAAIVAAQHRLMSDRRSAAATRAWAKSCETWTITQLGAGATPTVERAQHGNPRSTR
jgi:Ser/Thr protein kinase RdoA (MazF antagonist)